jgi:putative ABC transport system substrate-binding protein
LRALGWDEGRNVQIEYRWATTDAKRIEQSAKELVALQPDVILSANSPTTAALQRQTSTIPIVFAIVVDPVGQGFVNSMSRPGGNITGFVNLEASVAAKYLELLREIAPRVARVALYYNPKTAPYANIYLQSFKAAAASFGVEPIDAPIRDMTELEAVIAAIAREPNGGLIAMPDSFNMAHRSDVTSLAARYRVPTIYAVRQFAEAGGLISYGSDNRDNWRRTAGYVDRILKGAKPADLPVQAAVKFDLVINLKTARALGLEVPLILQQRADEVIE